MIKIRPTGLIRALGRLSPLACLGVLLLGCTHTPTMTTSQPKVDPLLGVPPPPAFPNQGTVPGMQPQASNAGVPAIPALHAPTNNATLASMTGRTPIGSLALNDAQRGQAPGQVTSRSPYLPPNPSPKVEPVPDAPGIMPTASWQTSAPPQPAAPAQPTEESLTRALRGRGVIGQKTDSTPAGLKLTCYVSVGANGVRVYEVTAPNYISAAQSILQQLGTN